MSIRHTVIFTFYESTSHQEIDELIARLNEMGNYLRTEVGVTDWNVANHIPELHKHGRADLLQDGIFPNIESLSAHANLETHKRVVALASKVCDWMRLTQW